MLSGIAGTAGAAGSKWSRGIRGRSICSSRGRSIEAGGCERSMAAHRQLSLDILHAPVLLQGVASLILLATHLQGSTGQQHSCEALVGALCSTSGTARCMNRAPYQPLVHGITARCSPARMSATACLPRGHPERHPILTPSRSAAHQQGSGGVEHEESIDDEEERRDYEHGQGDLPPVGMGEG